MLTLWTRGSEAGLFFGAAIAPEAEPRMSAPAAAAATTVRMPVLVVVMNQG
jgi:hypothetical protein